ncbi:MAG: AraC family transcriptional regulator, partial [Bacteroidota bacterium]
KAFELHVEEISKWGKRAHKHNFFEIVYVEQGSGYQCINIHEFEYQAGNIFLLPPLDCHSFRISEPSRFYYVRFTDHFFMGENGLTQYGDWFDNISYILANYNRIPGDIIASDRERQFIIQNIKTIHQEYATSDGYSEAIITGIVASILNILARSIEKRYVEKANEIENRFGEVLRYINKNLTDKEKIRLPALADRFGISQTYFSEYFKKQAGDSLANYIIKSKLRLVETKILHTDLSLKEIAYQLNFTDSSHLARSFKKTYGMTVTEFKSRGGNVCRAA